MVTAQQHGQIQLAGRDLMQALIPNSRGNSAMSDVSTADVVPFRSGHRSILSNGENSGSGDPIRIRFHSEQEVM